LKFDSFTQILNCDRMRVGIKEVRMSCHRLNIEFPSDDFIYLKMLCAEKGVSLKDFIIPLILKGMEEEEDALLIRKAQNRLKNMNESDLIPIEDAFKEAGWDV
jgi:hypothetical protein